MKILVQGWLGVPHSYAEVNREQLIAWAKTEDTLYFEELPLYRTEWKRTQKNYSDFLAEHGIKKYDNEQVDIIYRISFPYYIGVPKQQVPVFVFGTTEFGCLEDLYLSPPSQSLAQEYCQAGWLTFITPSLWSARGFKNLVYSVIPHGVNTEIFKPKIIDRMNFSQLKLSNEYFVVLSIGAMTGNKGIDLLIRAFIQFSKVCPNAILVLKGLDELYESSKIIETTVWGLIKLGYFDANTWIQEISPKIFIMCSTLDVDQVSDLINICDVYVSSYRAEGFGLTILNAMACGVPVICTEGGSTDDFASSCLKIKAQEQKFPKGYVLDVDVNSLVSQLIYVQSMSKYEYRRLIQSEIIEASKHTWESVVQDLREVIKRKLVEV